MPTSTTTKLILNQFNIHSNIFYSNLTNGGKHSGFGLINLIPHVGYMPLLTSRFVLKQFLTIKSYFYSRKTQSACNKKKKNLTIKSYFCSRKTHIYIYSIYLWFYFIIYSSKSSLGKSIFYHQNQYFLTKV